ncbi:MAG: 4a-hydroxytetrahydrobiopterin dehydratase [Candidatus Methylomirabilales bacterium]
MGLADNACVPCRGGVPPLPPQRVEELLRQLQQGWGLNARGHLERRYTFPDFAAAMRFANRLGEIADAEGHHPDLHVSWGACRVEIWTHKIHGLTESDFFLAAKADRAYEPFAVAAA